MLEAIDTGLGLREDPTELGSDSTYRRNDGVRCGFD